MPKTSYAIALGSNRRSRHGSPAAVIEKAAGELCAEHLSTIRLTRAVGPAGRGFANAAAILHTDLQPLELLAHLKEVEYRFGRRGGRRWGPRVLDLDIILWSEGSFESAGLVVPHPEFRRRSFVLDPLGEVAAEWRDPLTGLTVRQLRYRFLKRRPLTAALPTRR